MNHPQQGTQSPPLPNLHNLSLSPYPQSNGSAPPPTGNGAGGGDYRYNGVFGPPMPGGGNAPGGGSGWGSPNKRGSRSGLPSNWYDPSSRESPIPNSTYDAYRRDASSPPALSPPSSTTSGPTTSSSNINLNHGQTPNSNAYHQPYAQPHPSAYPPVDPSAFASMAVTPSPPPPSGMPIGQMPQMGQIGQLGQMGQMGQIGAMGQMGSQFGAGMGQMGGFGLPPNNSNPSLTSSASYTMPSIGMPQFGSQSLQSMHSNASGPPPRVASANPNGAGNGGGGSAGMWSSRNGFGLPPPSASVPADDDVIPTAIVIKNIPFAVPREQLLGVMESLGAPLPYAFNYHHDNGVFRGLAFANFRAPDEAAAVVAALNGYDVQGRKLRVEYKKVLQPGEKDKIEREKALKRMRSIQFDHSNMNKEMPPPLSIPNQRGAAPGINGRHSAEIDHSSPPQSASSGTSSDLPISLDLNDPTALDIYSRVLVFKEDRMRDELAFSRSLTPTERRIVHLVAQKLGLISITRGSDGETKYVVVTRDRDGISSNSSTSRPAITSSTSSAIVTSSAYLSPYSSVNAESLSPSLRIKKSMPDLRGFSGPVVARDPARSLTPQRSSGNLRGDSLAPGGGGGGGLGAVGSREYVSMGAAGGRRVNGGGHVSHGSQGHGHHGHGSGHGHGHGYGHGHGHGGYGGHSSAGGSTTGSGAFNSFFGSPIDSIPPVPPLPAGLGLHTHSSSTSAHPTSSPSPLAGHPSSSPIGVNPNPNSNSNPSNSSQPINMPLGASAGATSQSHQSKSSMSSLGGGIGGSGSAPTSAGPNGPNGLGSIGSGRIPSPSSDITHGGGGGGGAGAADGTGANSSSSAAPLRNPRGPASDGRGFGGGVSPNPTTASSSGGGPGSGSGQPGGLRTSASGILRGPGTTGSGSGGAGAPAGGGLGPIGGGTKRESRVQEEYEDQEASQGLGQDDGVELARTRESLEL